MSGVKAPERVLDPICDMVVVVANARAKGRTLGYAFNAVQVYLSPADQDEAV